MPTIIKMREGPHRNQVLRLSKQNRDLVKAKVVGLTVHFIKQKLGLLKLVRPMNAGVVREVLKSLSQIKCKPTVVPLDFKHYKTTGDILLHMIKDEIRGCETVRFGHQEIGSGEEVFFAISTPRYKSFDFETDQTHPEHKSSNKSKQRSMAA